MHKQVQQSDPFVNYVIHHESKLKVICSIIQYNS